MEISVIIVNRNYEQFLARAIRSVLNQSYNKDEYEIIVVDDCSTDRSLDVLSLFADRVKVIVNQQNEGLAASCNKAIKSALGKFIVRVDSDDFVHNDFLKMHHLFLAHNKDDIDITSSDYYEVDLKENVLCRKNGITWPIGCGLMLKTDDFLRLGGYNQSLPREDIDFRQRLLKSGKQIYNICVPLYRYTQHAESLTKSEKQNG